MLKVEEEEENEEQEVEYTESWGERNRGAQGLGMERGTHHGSHQRMRDKSEGEHRDAFNMDGRPVDGHTPHSTGWDLPASRKLN